MGGKGMESKGIYAAGPPEYYMALWQSDSYMHDTMEEAVKLPQKMYAIQNINGH